MKHIKHLLIALLLFSCTTPDEFEVDGISYRVLSNNTVKVVTKSKGLFSGNVIIPESVKYGYATYTVTSIGDSAFFGCDALTDITIPNSVTTIGEDAFYECSALTGITIPNSVTTIGDYAFFGCDALTDITIPNSVTTIGKDAFYKCSALTGITVSKDNPVYDSRDNCNAIIETATNTIIRGCENTVIPNNVTTIGDSAFFGCDALIDVTIPNSVTTIGDGAFRDCSALTNVTIPNSVTTIGEYAFYGCSALTSVHINDLSAWCNIEFEGFYANPLDYGGGLYLNGTLLTELTIPNSVTSIGDWAFSGCSSLTNVTIPNSVTSIGYCAFHECYALTSITIPNSVTTIGDAAFSRCNLTNIIIPNSVTTIGEHAFYKCFSLTSVTIGNRVKTIGEDAFYEAFLQCGDSLNVHINDLSAWCNIEFEGSRANPMYYAGDLYLNGTLLTKLIIPDDVTVVKDYTFCYCDGRITSITIPNSVTTIGEHALPNCSALTRITVSKDNPVYDSRDNCNALIETATNTLILGCENTVIPNSVTTIGKSAFFRCDALTSITIPNSVTTIGEDAFSHCYGLTNIIIPNSVTTIGESTFSYCSALTSITIPNSVTTIGDRAFFRCDALTSITIPNSVTCIGEDAFLGCSALTSITVSKDNPVYDSRDNCNALIETATNTLILGCENTVIPNSVTTIGEDAFYECYALTSITIPNSVTTIGDGVFWDCDGLTNVTIPNSVTTIGHDAFYGCDALTSITVSKDNPVYDSRDNCNAIIETATNTIILGCKNTVVPDGVKW